MELYFLESNINSWLLRLGAWLVDHKERRAWLLVVVHELDLHFKMDAISTGTTGANRVKTQEEVSHFLAPAS